jgi:hypothetical protein
VVLDDAVAEHDDPMQGWIAFEMVKELEGGPELIPGLVATRV